VAGQRAQRRVVGRRRWKLPAWASLRRLEAPRLTARWRRGLAFACLAAVLVVGGYWLYRSPLLTVQDVSVEGNQVLTVEQLRAVAGLKGQSIFAIDEAGAEARLRALPLVKDASVAGDPPNGARITIVEREPWGVWQAGGERFVIDDEGVVIDRPVPQEVPVVVQTDAPGAALAAGSRVPAGAVAAARRLVAESEAAVGLAVTRLEFSQASGLSVTLGDRLHVAFGDAQGYEFKVATLFAVLQRARQDGRALTRVDLRFGDRVAVQ
jgi:cell division protein FtsQ